MDEKTHTLNPDPAKKGAHINKQKYDQRRRAILDILTEREALTFTQLSHEVENRLCGSFDGSVPWYVVSVKLDLEARNIIERTTHKPHRVHIK